jgi:CDP-glycerol glycerophosphotransferase
VHKAQLLAGYGQRVGVALRRRVRSMAGTVLRWGRAAVGMAVYRLLCLLPVDPRLAVYAAYWYRGYACNPAAVYEKARELVPQVRGVWVVDQHHAATMPVGVSYVVKGSMRYYRTLARARWLINNVNFPDFVVKRRGTTYLQTHHGTPVKVMGLDQDAFPFGAQGMDMAGLLRRSDLWDFSVTSNAHSTEVWARAYPCRYETLEHGYPRNDRLARAAGPDGAADVAATRRRLDLPDGATVVLYAPTLREYVSGFRPLLDVEEFADALGPDVIVLQRAHYFYGHSFYGHSFYGHSAGSPHPAVRDVSGNPVVEDLMVASDILVTDYSSVMFDYAVLDRPMVIYAPDWDSYRRTRGVTFDLLAEPPGVVATNQADLVDAFRTGTVWGDTATKARAQFRARFAYLDDGHAAERVVRRVFATELDCDSARASSAASTRTPAGDLAPEPLQRR